MSLLDTITTQSQAENIGMHRKEQSKLLPHMFYSKYVKDNSENVSKGRPFYKVQDFIKIQLDEVNRIDTLATDEHKRLYSESWRKYCDKRDLKVDGTLLAEASFIPKTEAMALNDLGIMTVEELVQNEGKPAIDQFYVDLAKTYLKRTELDGNLYQLVAMIKDLKTRLEYAESVIKELRNGRENNNQSDLN